MSADALFQLGIVSVALNTSQTEEFSCRYPRHSVVHARAALFSNAHRHTTDLLRPRMAGSSPVWHRLARPIEPHRHSFRERMPI